MDFIVITGPSYEIAEKKIRRLAKIDAGIEMRLDLFDTLSKERIKEILALCKEMHKPVILTLRSKAAGGNFSGSEEQLEEELKALAALGPDYMDVEWSLSDELFESLEGVNIIASHHDFNRTPALGALFERMQCKKAYAYKICTTAQDESDAFRMIQFIHKRSQEGHNIIGLCMGEEGKITRIDGPKAGNYLNYKIIHSQDKVAAGLDFT